MNYDNNRPLIIAPGETKYIDFMLQSSPKENAMKINLQLLDDNGIASLVDKISEYDVPSGGEIKSKIKVSIPSNAVNGTEYSIVLLAKDMILSEEAGMIAISSLLSISFRVKVIKHEADINQEKINLNFFMLLGILIVAVLFVFVIAIYKIFRRKSSQQNY